jgi:osmotically-inducible protein OsmY
MSLRFRDDDDDSTGHAMLGVVAGAVAGFAIGMFVSKRFGGLDGIVAALRERMPDAGRRNRAPIAAAGEAGEEDDFDDLGDDELMGEDYDAALEERVLSVFQNDPVLSERAIDIGSLGGHVIELDGTVESEAEAEHAVTLASGVPDVETVVNRLAITSQELRFEETARLAESRPETHR